jgi:hypothetical protein
LQRCRLEGGKLTDGILLVGSQQSGGIASRYLEIRQNSISGVLRGLHVLGAVADVQVAGNRIFNCSQEGLGIEDLTPNAGPLLLANNTLFKNDFGFRGWINPPSELGTQKVALFNNLVLDNREGDITVVGVMEGNKGMPSADLAKRAAEMWRFEGNARDLSSNWPIVPLAAGDRKLHSTLRLPGDPALPDFLRPPSDSALSSQGVGQRDPSLPVYIGAVPPQGVAPWDWDRTWRTHVHAATGRAK